MKHINYVDGTTTELKPNGDSAKAKGRLRNLPRTFELFLADDFHLGNASANYSDMEKFVRHVKKTKHGYVAFQGDQLETIGITDKRFDLGVHFDRKPRFDAQRDLFIELFDKIGDRVLWVLDGNHERSIKNICLPNKDIAEEFGAIYAGGTLVKAMFPWGNLLSWHGWGTISSYAGDQKQRRINEQIALKRRLRRLPVADCEVVACGHYHKLIHHEPDPKLLLVSDKATNRLYQHYTEPSRIWIDQKKGLYRIPDEERHYICCGSFLKGYDENIPSYSEDWGLEATELGYGHVVIKNDKLVKVETVPLESWNGD